MDFISFEPDDTYTYTSTNDKCAWGSMTSSEVLDSIRELSSKLTKVLPVPVSICSKVKVGCFGCSCKGLHVNINGKQFVNCYYDGRCHNVDFYNRVDSLFNLLTRRDFLKSSWGRLSDVQAW